MEQVHIGKLAQLSDRFKEEIEWDIENASACGWTRRDLMMIKEGFSCAYDCVSKLIKSSIDGFVSKEEVLSLSDQFDEAYHLNRDNAKEFGWTSQDVAMLAEGLAEAHHIIEKDIIFKDGEFI